MRLLLISICIACGALAQESAPKPEPRPAGVPEDAELISPRTWRHKDASGKAWLYISTPFGLSRTEEPAERKSPGTAEQLAGSVNKAGAPAAGPVFRASAVKGDTVHFERDTPFGKTKWTRSKSQLDAEEKAALELFEKKAAPAKPAKQGGTK